MLGSLDCMPYILEKLTCGVAGILPGQRQGSFDKQSSWKLLPTLVCGSGMPPMATLVHAMT
jgi:hypothetical protein